MLGSARINERFALRPVERTVRPPHGPPMKLVDIKQTLRGGAIQPSQRLGQNFLHDAHYLRRIAELAEVSNGDRVLEIGPGTGALTGVLLGLGANVRAIEKDRRLAEHLGRTYSHHPQFGLIQGDGLHHLRESNEDWREWKLVSNLPYSVASPILVEMAAKPSPPKLMVVTVQLEVANRIRAQAGGREFGLLSLLVQSRFKPGASIRIPPGCFYPVPQVESACLRLERRAHPLLEPNEWEVFGRITRRGFSQRRKMLINLLKQDWPAKVIHAAFLHLGLPSQVRAEAVSLEQFAELARILSKVEG